MIMEGSYHLKEPCYDGEVLINPRDDFTCLPGSPWNEQYSQRIMGGQLPGKNSSVSNVDNFHRVYAIKPVHLAEIDSDCSKDDSVCVMNTVTVS